MQVAQVCGVVHIFEVEVIVHVVTARNRTIPHSISTASIRVKRFNARQSQRKTPKPRYIQLNCNDLRIVSFC